MYGELRGHKFHNHRQHRTSHQDQNQHRHRDCLDYCGESSWADLEMADFVEVGWRSKCGDQEGGHTCVLQLAFRFRTDVLWSGWRRALLQTGQKKQRADGFHVGVGWQSGHLRCRC